MNVDQERTTHYKQMATVDLNTLNLINANRLFNGFGDFTGSFDGNGYRIDGIDIVAPGLFKSNSGTLKNIRLTTGLVDATGSAYTGAIVGTNSGSVIACVNEARIINTGNTVTIYGGIVGLNQSTGTIVGCVNTGVIKQGDVVGGIVGENQSITANSLVACISTGALNPEATYLGFICGKSVATNNIVLNNGFGLVGTAQHVIGSPELGVGTDNIGFQDVSALEPAILRNGLPADDTNEANRIINRLNRALSVYPSVAAVYEFVYDDPTSSAEPVTGITWPAPVMINP